MYIFKQPEKSMKLFEQCGTSVWTTISELVWLTIINEGRVNSLLTRYLKKALYQNKARINKLFGVSVNSFWFLYKYIQIEVPNSLFIQHTQKYYHKNTWYSWYIYYQVWMFWLFFKVILIARERSLCPSLNWKFFLNLD